MSLMLDEAVAKKTPKKVAEPEAKPDNRKPVVMQLRGSEEWKEWIENVATKEGHTLAKLVEIAVRKLAKENGYPDPPLR